MKAVIGIDIGGTNLKAGLFDTETGRCLCQKSLPTRDGEMSGGVPAWAVGVQALVVALEGECGQSRLRVGVSAPGLARRDGAGVAWMPGRLAGIENFIWADFLQREARVLNDAHAALLGEVWQGAARGGRDVLLLTLGTGVGGAAMLAGRLLTGHLGRAGHFGHISLDPTGPPTIARTPGGLEDAIGNATVLQRTNGRFASTRHLLDAVQTGDAEATQAWDISVRALAAGMTSLINAFDPEMFILGGGIASGAGEMLLAPLAEHLDAMEWRPGGHRVKVVLAQLGEWAGTYGAAWHVLGQPAASYQGS